MNIELKAENEAAPKGKRASRQDQVAQIKGLIDTRNEALLVHDYFLRCRANAIGHDQMLAIVEQLYCFSIFFERLLARRIAEHSSGLDSRIIEIARAHMQEEIGHARLFRACLRANGLSEREIDRLSPKTFTKAMFGYLTVTIQHESEYVANIAIVQVMEGIAYLFFTATLKAMTALGMNSDVMSVHLVDEEHQGMGLDLVAEFSDADMRDCRRVIDDLYNLMSHMLHEWLGQSQGPRSSIEPVRRRRSSRPPKRVAGLS